MPVLCAPTESNLIADARGYGVTPSGSATMAPRQWHRGHPSGTNMIYSKDAKLSGWPRASITVSGSVTAEPWSLGLAGATMEQTSCRGIYNRRFHMRYAA